MREFNSDRAAAAGGSGGISVGGDYLVGINVAFFKDGNDNAKYVEFLGKELNTEADFKYVKLYTKKKDGGDHFEGNFVDAIMGLNNIQKLSTQLALHEGQNVTIIPELKGTKFIVKLQREDYVKKDGSGDIGFSMKVVNVFDPESRKTYSELMKQQPAKAIEHSPADKRLEKQAGAQQHSGGFGSSAPIDDDLPF